MFCPDGVRDPAVAAVRLEALLVALPSGWRAAGASAAAAAGAPVGGGMEAVLRACLPRLRWPQLNGRLVSLARLTVRRATLMQLRSVQWERTTRHLRFLALACSGVAEASPGTPTELRRVFRALLRARWGNKRLEVYWRLALDALPTAARMHLPPGPASQCVCGASVPGVAHLFWDCPVAEAVRAALQAALGGAQVPPLRRDQLWLARVPVAAAGGAALVLRPLWPVVCLAALCALDAARAHAEQQRHARVPVAPAGPARLAAVRAFAVARCWDLLTDFAAGAGYPAAWAGDVAAWQPGAPHPFFEQLPGRPDRLRALAAP